MSKLLLMDGHSILNRAFFGLPDLTNSFGEHTGAVYGFLTMMFRFIELEKPDNIMVAFDMHAPTFRHKMFDAYKGTRKPMQSELKEQVPRIQEMLKAMGITVITCEGFEADDILGTLSVKAQNLDYDVTIVSGDRDLLQLATKRVKISIPKTKKTGTEIENYFEDDVFEAYHVSPKQFIDVKALQGDTADNIPGVEGIGEKTAQALIAAYGSIEECYAHVTELKPPRASKNLAQFWEVAQLSKVLATINLEAPVEFDVEGTKLGDFYTQEAYVLCKRYEFKKLLPNFEKKDVSSVSDNSHESFKYISDLSIAKGFFAELELCKDYVGVDFAYENEKLYFAALSTGENTCALKVNDEISSEFLIDSVIQLSKKGVKLAFFDVKKSMHIMYKLVSEDMRKNILNEGAKLYLLPNAYDVSVAAYLLDSIRGSYTSENVAADALDMVIQSQGDLLGKKKIFDALEDASCEDALLTIYGYNAFVAAKSIGILLSRVDEAGMSFVFSDIEMPLVYTLFDMELQGIYMNSQELEAFGEKLTQRIGKLEQEIYSAAGEEFNINSPKQLGVILFEKLEIPGGKKTKTGYSTAADILEELAADNPIISSILEYRQLTKLKSTYVEGLMKASDEDGRVRSTFMQTVTATGRISSTEPNLQNIPIRMELGREIRKVFYPKDGFVFLDADYSQIELRVLAHMSEDTNLINAFKAGQDIHRSTAALVFKKPFDEVTDNERRAAKAVNFGIVYGISAFGLAKDIGISRKNAQEYIDNYFVAYPKMHDFLEKLKQDAKDKGYAVTMCGRRRPIPELSSSNFMQKQFGERIAMNSPVQGSAADIIKLAMVKVHDRLLEEKLESKLILQVHDELLVETKADEVDSVRKIISEEMENAYQLSVKLEIDMHAGNTWFEAK